MKQERKKRYLKRGIHFDFHTMPGIYDFGRDFDAKEFARKLDEAHVTIINMAAQCNVGFSYYPTKIGTPYPGMKGDMFGDILKECHARGIKVVAYINVGLNSELARKNAQWCRIGEDGSIIRGDRTDPFCRSMCYNTGYGDYAVRIIEEICENYDVDGLFADCMFIMPCYCNKCTEDMLGQGIDIQNRDEVTRFSKKVMLEFCRRVRQAVPADKLLYFNGMHPDEVQEYEHHIEVECLPSSGWGYDTFYARASYDRNLQKDVLYMTGRFQSDWGDFGGFKPKASIENDIYDALCAGVQYSVGDHLHPAENLENDIYEIVKEIYGRTMQYEKYTDESVYQSDIGVLQNIHNVYNIDLERNGTSVAAYRSGVSRMLAELKQSYDIINENMDFDRFKVILLPDVIQITDKLCDKLKAYLKKGGKLLFSGSSGLNQEKTDFAFEELKEFLDYEGLDESNASYYVTRKKICEAQMKYSMYDESILMRAKDDSDVAADYIKPYFNKHWDGLLPYFYLPAEKKTGQAAAARKGNIAYICFNIFSAYYKKASVFHKQLVKSLLDELLPEPLIRTVDMPSTSRVTLTGTDDYKLLHVKVTFPEPRGKMDVIEEHVTLPAGRQVLVRGEYKRVCRLPEETSVPCEYADGYTKVTLPEITGYDMFLLR